MPPLMTAPVSAPPLLTVSQLPARTMLLVAYAGRDGFEPAAADGRGGRRAAALDGLRARLDRVACCEAVIEKDDAGEQAPVAERTLVVVMMMIERSARLCWGFFERQASLPRGSPQLLIACAEARARWSEIQSLALQPQTDAMSVRWAPQCHARLEPMGAAHMLPASNRSSRASRTRSPAWTGARRRRQPRPIERWRPVHKRSRTAAKKPACPRSASTRCRRPC